MRSRQREVTDGSTELGAADEPKRTRGAKMKSMITKLISKAAPGSITSTELAAAREFG